MRSRLPNLLIAGAPRSGTTFLRASLTRRPEVFAPPSKEVHFFTIHHRRGASWYRSLYSPAPAGARYLLDASPSYLGSPSALLAARRLLGPDVQLVIALREPLDRLVSHYWWEIQRGQFRGSFDQFVTERPHALSASLYRNSLPLLRQLWPEDQLCWLVSEQLFESPDLELDRLAAFLSLQLRVPVAIDARNEVTRVRIPGPLLGAAHRARRRLNARQSSRTNAVGRSIRNLLSTRASPRSILDVADYVEFFEPDRLAVLDVVGADRLRAWDHEPCVS